MADVWIDGDWRWIEATKELDYTFQQRLRACSMIKQSDGKRRDCRVAIAAAAVAKRTLPSGGYGTYCRPTS